MGGTFNPQILAEKLCKLNNSQQSIETLSHWCIFHMSKAKLVVETWDRQFHCSPRERRLPFLYLANDILQNSRRKGSEFVSEFWKVLPEALRDMIESGDDFGKTAAVRLIGIWEDRKVFGSRGQILKEELLPHKQTDCKDEFKLKYPLSDTVDRVVSGYNALYGGQLDEDSIVRKCEDAIALVEKTTRDIHSSGIAATSGRIQDMEFLLEELQGQNTLLKDCAEQLTAVESSRAILITHLRDALQEQEAQMGQVRSQLQAVQCHCKRSEDMCLRLASGGTYSPPVRPHPIESTAASSTVSVPVMFAPGRSSAAAAIAAKLTASTSSAQMLSYVLSSLASEGIIAEGGAHSHPDKRPKIGDDVAPYPLADQHPPLPPQLPPPPPPPPLMPPMMPPYPIPQFCQPAASTSSSSLPSLPYAAGYMTGNHRHPHHHHRPVMLPPFPPTPHQQIRGKDAPFHRPSMLLAPPYSR